MKEKMICRGDLFYYDFGDNSGSVQSGERPVLVVQADDYNQNAPTIIVAAVTSVIKKRYVSSEEYEMAASDAVNNPESLHKTEKEDGDDVYYKEDTNEFVIVSTDRYIRSNFNPDFGKKCFDRQ